MSKFTKANFKKAAKRQQVDPKEVLKRVEAHLETELGNRSEDEQPQQYEVLKAIIGRAEAKALKDHFGITEYVSEHNMRWMLINVFNEED